MKFGAPQGEVAGILAAPAGSRAPIEIMDTPQRAGEWRHQSRLSPLGRTRYHGHFRGPATDRNDQNGK